MKVKTKVLTGFLKKARMSGSQQIEEAILRFEDDGLKIDANSAANQSRVMSWLKKDTFEDYSAIGKVGMNDLETVVKVLDRFGEKITLKKEGNLLTVSEPGKRVEIELVAENFLSTDTGEPELEFDHTFTLPATQIKNIFKDVKLNKDVKIILETGDKKVIFSNTGKYKFRTEVGAPTCTPGTKVVFGEPFIDSIENLDSNLDISIKENYPAKIRENTDTGVVTVIVAPRVEDDEAEE